MSQSVGERTRIGAPTTPTAVRPIMLATIDVPFALAAIAFATDTARETGADLLICHGIGVPVGNPAAAAARSFGDPATLASVALLARELGDRVARVRHLQFQHPRPARELPRLCAEEGVGLLVFGPERRRYGRWRYDRTLRRLHRDAPCFVWP